MSTNCKLIIGYTDHMDYWNTTETYYRHYDGYEDAIIPLLKKYKSDVTAMNEIAEYGGHEWEELESLYDGVTRPDYLYYIDVSDGANIRCTVLKDDLEYYRKYNISNYKVIMELVL